MTRLLHVALAREWHDAETSGTYAASTLGATHEEVGFVHCATPAQVPGVLHRFYADVTEPLVLLELDPDRLEAAGADVRWESAVAGGEEFPHLCAPIDPAWVTRAHPITPASKGVPGDDL